MNSYPLPVRLPEFYLSEYVDILRAFAGKGFEFQHVGSMALESRLKVVYLRHDVDLDITRVLPMARAEAELGAVASYFVLLSGRYNVLNHKNRDVLTTLTQLGHEIGLHYDLEQYPVDDVEAARSQLEWECDVLSTVCGSPVVSIATHNPALGYPDPFTSTDDFVHPHDPRLVNDLLYVSDSCRARRNEDLLRCFRQQTPNRVLLNTHPELWLAGNVADRTQYLREIVLEGVLNDETDYFAAIATLWSHHQAPKLDDERTERMRRGSAR